MFRYIYFFFKEQEGVCNLSTTTDNTT